MKRCLFLIGCAFLASQLVAGTVTGWRNDGTSTYPDATPPLTWSPSNNIIWKTALPAWGNSSPILVGNRLFICAEPNLLVCLDAATGNLLWQASNTLAMVNMPETPPKTHGVNGFSSPTPTSDGKTVYVLYGTGIAAAYDLDGKKRWIRFIEAPKNGWGHSASPLLAGNLLIVSIINVFGLDPATGATRWQTPSKPHWGSPVAATVAGTPLVITTDGEILRATDGVKLAEKIFALTYCAPLSHGNRLYFIEKNGKCVELPNAITTNRIVPRLVWTTTPKEERYYASPVLHEGLVYAVMQHGHVSAIDAADGTVVGQKKLPASGTFYPSICVAGGHLFISGEKGITHVLKPGKDLEVVAENKLEAFRSTPLFAGARIYIHGLKHLYCIGPAK